MVGWGALEKALDKVGGHTNLIGKYWITSFNMIRLLFLFTIGASAWSGGAKLECDTKTPGCQMMCINHFYPLAPITFWSLQVLFVCLPTVIFMVYADHIEGKMKFAIKVRAAIRNDNKMKSLKHFSKQKSQVKEERERLTRKRQVSSEMGTSEVDAIKWLDQEEARINENTERMDKEIKTMIKDETEESKKAISATGGLTTPPTLLLAYGTMAFFRVVIEILFVLLYFKLYSFDLVMPEKYHCTHYPCNNAVACYIDRPKQKTFTICFMLASIFMTICIGLLELWCIGLGNFMRAFQNRHKDITKEYSASVAAIYATYSKQVASPTQVKGASEHLGM